MIRIEQLYISPGHNYFGRHGQTADDHELLQVDEIECVAGAGIRGDRFFEYKDNYKGQITFFAMEDLEALRCELNLPQAQPSATRRNVITSGVKLAALIGVEFEIQGVRFLGMEECRPCYWMDEALGPGAEAWLKGRGGLRAQILSTGVLRKTL